jgi:excisionase family DNA binding protein
MSRLVDAPVVAEHLSVPVSWVREQARAENIPHVRLGRYVRFDLEAVDAWWQAMASGAPASAPRYRKHRPAGV